MRVLHILNNTVYDETGNEVTEFTTHEQDYLVKQLYPKDTNLLSVEEMGRRQKSYSGVHGFDMSQFPNSEIIQEDEMCSVIEKIYQLGGHRLLTLYCNKFDFHASALDLNIKYGAIVKWFQRFRSQVRKLELTEKDFLD